MTYSGHDKSRYGFSVRCLRDTILIARPSVGLAQINTSTMTATSADASSGVASDGGSTVTARGICWNTTGNPTMSDNVIPLGSGTGNFTGTITGLTEGVNYYVRAYATNSVGTSYSEGTGFAAVLSTICPDTFNILHTIGFRGVPVTKRVTYHAVSTYLSGAAKCWITQNLGADTLARSATDASERAAGWYFQFNHSLGYKNDGTGTTPVAWITGFNEASDWTAINDPCTIMLGADWRIPTSTEWTNANGAPQNWTSYTDTYNSSLKLHNAGYLAYNSGGLGGRGSQGNYWSSTGSANTSAWDLQFYNTASAMISHDKAYGFSVRCLRNGIVKVAPTLSKVSLAAMTDSTAEGTATIVTNGGSPILHKGLCWNSTGNPTISDNKVENVSSDTTYTSVMTGLKEGMTYYVRAYAANKIGLSYSPVTVSFKICKPIKAIHIAGLNGAPVSKNVTYKAVSTDISGKMMCWITQNLGADTLANSVTDAREKSGGWHWQFNRKQGYIPSGTSYLPNNAWESWPAVSENSDWLASNDPCNLLLGLGWRLPTATEWTNADGAPQNWGSPVDAYNSVLKLHLAGELVGGTLTNKGSYSGCWSSSQYNGGGAYVMYLYPGYSGVTWDYKSYAYPVRCIRDSVMFSAPTVSNVVFQTSDMTSNSALGSATVTLDGGSTITARGLCWNTTGMPTIADHLVNNGSGLGAFSCTMDNLSEVPTYYVRAYATNSKGTSYSQVVSSFKICPSSFSVIHTAGTNGAPVNKTVTYHSINSNMSGKPACWLTQNLGADLQAISPNDTAKASGGWYWQFNRKQGYIPSGTSYLPNNAWESWPSVSENSDWLAVNDPCNLMLGNGWRIPAAAEWTAADAPPQNWGSPADAYNSVLKLHLAGELVGGALTNKGSYSGYWSSSQYSGGGAYVMYLYPGYSGVTWDYKSYAYPVRCIRDTVTISVPTVSNIVFQTSDMTSNSALGSATVTLDGGSPVTVRGLCWNTTGMPTIADHLVNNGSGLGVFICTMDNLTEVPTYYVRAYATNSQGTSYSPVVTSFKICPSSFKIIHTAGVNGAPVNKTVTYHSINSSISGKSACWLTQNLGADQQATAFNDTTKASAGWYWQFNRQQGYIPSGSAYFPKNAWESWPDVSESSDWTTINDPCNLMLGTGWRIPTYNEWLTTDAPPQNWGSPIDAYNSVLKLHLAGDLVGGSFRNSYNGYWSSSQYSGGGAYVMYLYSGYSGVTWDYKSYAYPVRCIRDSVTISAPTVSNIVFRTSDMTSNSALGSATVTLDGGSTITARGLCWNTTGMPTIADHLVNNGSGLGAFSCTMDNLSEVPTYYVRAYATNSKGTSYSQVVSSFKICPSSFNVIHTAGTNGAPVSKSVIYHSISSGISGKSACWLTQNLGADLQAISPNDTTKAAGGWYWQFNRKQGYIPSGSSYLPNNAWESWPTVSESSDWLAANDPCNLLLGVGWRIPTYNEWLVADAPPQNWGSPTDAYNSVLRLHLAGELVGGALANKGSYSGCWSSSQYNGGGAYLIYLYPGYSGVSWDYKSSAYPVRCIRDSLIVSAPVVSNSVFQISDMTSNSALGSATVTLDGGSTVVERGFCWNTTGKTPTLSDNVVRVGSGGGIFAKTLTGLLMDSVYYIRAYAINDVGVAYSTQVTSFKMCPQSFDVVHVAGINGSPVTKTVTYHSISSAISGKPACWLTQNLGADQQANSLNDGSDGAMGWFWQFNRKQGYTKIGTGGGWPDVSENSEWIVPNDPCNVLLGAGWRIPTYNEWLVADAPPQNWGSPIDAYNSVLKLHLAGDLVGGSFRNSYNGYWSSSQYSAGGAYVMYLYPGYSGVTWDYKSYAYPVRCIR